MFIWVIRIVHMKIKQTIKTGISFGLTSGIITTLGVMSGLNAGTHSRAVVIGGILTIAIADAVSDAFGIHVSEESDPALDSGDVWESTIATFIAKFIIVGTFMVPILIFPLEIALYINFLYGMYVLLGYTVYLAIRMGRNPAIMGVKHLAIAFFIIITTNLVGKWIVVVFQ